MSVLKMLCTAAIAFLACLWAAAPVVALLGLARIENQQPLHSTSSPQSSNYSVGFNLASSYGAAAVIIDNADGEKEILAWVVHDDLPYQKVMARLSLDSSRHLAPPYEGMDDYFADVPRVMIRRLLKKGGLPASFDVGVLATVIKKLRFQIKSDLKITVSDAALAIPHLEALYQDDVEDICENAGFQYIEPKKLYQHILWETSSAYGGYGFGWCEHWRNDTQCDIENVKLPVRTVLGVHYSRTALTSTLAIIAAPVGSWEGFGRRVENFTLGSNAKAGYRHEVDYWRDVRGALLQKMMETPAMKKPEMIILTSDMVFDADFRDVLEEAMSDYLGWAPPIFSENAVVVAAKGVAELRRRGKAPWSK